MCKYQFVNTVCQHVSASDQFGETLGSRASESDDEIPTNRIVSAARIIANEAIVPGTTGIGAKDRAREAVLGAAGGEGQGDRGPRGSRGESRGLGAAQPRSGAPRKSG